MMMLPFQVSSTEYSVFVVLEDENLARIREYDPADVDLKKVSIDLKPGLKCKQIHIGYGTTADVQEIMKLCQEGQVGEALRRLNRGWAYKPELGDHDGPYLRAMSEGTKQ